MFDTWRTVPSSPVSHLGAVVQLGTVLGLCAVSPPAWSSPAGEQEGEIMVSGTDPAPRGRETPGSREEQSRGSSSEASAGVSPAKLPPGLAQNLLVECTVFSPSFGQVGFFFLLTHF